ncbi:MAG: hypothetical protein AAGJ81_01420 [Verrucomicrobiota bacterium]
MSRISSISSDPTIRTFAQGAAQSAIRAVANFLAPAVPVPTLTGKHKVYDEKNRFHVPNTKRGLGGRAARIGFDASDANYNCEPNALDFPIDNLEKMEGDQLINMANYGSRLVADVAALAHEKEVLTKGLSAIGAGTDSNFTAASADPVAEIDAAILEVIKAARNGAPVKVLFGATAWLRTKNNTNVKKQLVANQKSAVKAIDLAAFRSLLFSEPECQMSLMVEDVAAEGLDDDIEFLLDDSIIVFASSDNPTTLDPSFMKTFRLDGGWMVPGSYETEDGRGEVLKMDWSEDVEVTNAPAAKRINATDS